MTAVHRPDHPAAAVAVVVVVAREDVAKRVQAGLVIVALAVADDLELGPVAIGPQGMGELIGGNVPAAFVDDVEVLGSFRVVLLDRAAAVTVCKVKLAVQAQDHAVHPVVGINAAETGQERVALVGLVVAVGILEHQEVGTIADEDAAAGVFAGLVVMLFDGDAHGHGEDPVGEDGDLVGLTVAIGIFENLDAVGLLDTMEPLVAAAGQAIVQALGDPDPSSGVDVDVGRVDQQRLGRPERRFQPLRPA